MTAPGPSRTSPQGPHMVEHEEADAASHRLTRKSRVACKWNAQQTASNRSSATAISRVERSLPQHQSRMTGDGHGDLRAHLRQRVSTSPRGAHPTHQKWDNNRGPPHHSDQRRGGRPESLMRKNDAGPDRRGSARARSA